MSQSQLNQLKTALQSYAQATDKQAAGLAPLRKACDQSSKDIQRLIGGSAQRKDAEVSQAVAEAQRQIDQAADALRRAATVAKQYASTL